MSAITNLRQAMASYREAQEEYQQASEEEDDDREVYEDWEDTRLNLLDDTITGELDVLLGADEATGQLGELATLAEARASALEQNWESGDLAAAVRDAIGDLRAIANTLRGEDA